MGSGSTHHWGAGQPMHIKELFTDDDAVSPVIGVILMVAITVILAAVIASFVLGLGNDATNTNPQASFSFDYDEAETTAAGEQGLVTISHDGGDSVDDQEIYVRGDGFNGTAPSDSVPAGGTLASHVDGLTGTEPDMGQAGPWDGTKSGDDSAIVSGDRVYVYAYSDYEFDVVYEAQEGQSSSTLASDDGPDA